MHRDHDIIQLSSRTTSLAQWSPTLAASSSRLLTAHQPSGKPYTSNNSSINYTEHFYNCCIQVICRVVRKKVDDFTSYGMYTIHILKISIIYMYISKTLIKMLFVAASHFRKCPIARSVKSVRRKYVYLWYHEWCRKGYLTNNIAKNINSL